MRAQRRAFEDLNGSLPPNAYDRLMSRLLCLSIVILLLPLPWVSAEAAHRHGKHPHPPHTYGFLPGYHQPLNNAAPLFKQEASVLRNARREQRHWYIGPTPHYYWYEHTVLFRPARILPRPLQRRQHRPVLDADADRTGVDLRVSVR